MERAGFARTIGVANAQNPAAEGVRFNNSLGGVLEFRAMSKRTFIGDFYLLAYASPLEHKGCN